MFHRIKTDEQDVKKEPADQNQADQTQTEFAENSPEEVEQPSEATEGETQPQEEASTETTEVESQTETPTETEEEEAPSMTAEPQEQDFEIEEEATTEESAQAHASMNATPYQTQPAAPASRAPGSYPGAAYAAGAPTYGTQASQDAEEQAAGDRKLTIGPGINMSGEIESCDHLIVEGTVEAALRGASFLEIEETGTYYGSVEISEAIIAGRFEGDLAVDGRITVRSTGVVTGTISYKELEVESGAVIDGRITPMKASAQETAEAEGARAKERAAAIAKAKEIKAKQTGQKQAEPANTDGALFQNQAAAE